ncbi:MAG TPA: tRNA lysidine(34) synthetase TilS [Propionibacteriaceae bacterium]|jgi:tRNA(Ile)-lysidine synthase
MARRALGPATLAVVQAVTESLVPQDQALLVACSGGPDSLAVAVGAQQVARRRSLPLAAVVVDHGLQHGSADIAQRAREQLEGLGYEEVVIRRAQVDVRSKDGPEGAARRARYEALDAEAEPRSATVLLGHTLDDQAETVLLGLARGSGLRSLAGMALRSGCYLRPLLALRRTTTERSCAEQGLEPWLDPHNDDPSFARSRTRSRVLPVLEAELGPGIANALARTAALARDDADLLDALATAAHPPGDTLDCDVLQQTAPSLRRRVIRSWLSTYDASEVSYLHVHSVEKLVTSWHGQLGTDLPGVRVTRESGRLVCTPHAC